MVQNILKPSVHKILMIEYFTAVSIKRNSTQRQDVYLRVLDTLQDFKITLGISKPKIWS